MKKLDLFVMIRDTSYFKKGQKVWMVICTGDLAYECIGRFRGRGRWVLGWVHVKSANPSERYHTQPDCAWKGEVEVSEKFYQHYRQIVGKIVKNPYWDVSGL